METDRLTQLRAQVKMLIATGKIRTFSGVDDLTQDVLEQIIQDYTEQKLSGVNRTIFTGLIHTAGFLAKHKYELDEEQVQSTTETLLQNEMLVENGVGLIKFITPHIPLIGLITGGVIVTKFLWDGYKQAKQCTEPVDVKDGV